MKLQILATLFAGAAIGGTIPVTGSGSFALDNFYDSNASACFSGSNGPDSVFVCANGVPIGPAPPGSLNGAWLFSAEMPGFATINGVTSNHFEVSLGEGQDGYINFMNGQNVVLSQAISGTIQITSYQESGTRWIVPGLVPNDEWNARGTFAIVSADDPSASPIPIPEAGSGILMGIGLAALLVGRNKRGVS